MMTRPAFYACRLLEYIQRCAHHEAAVVVATGLCQFSGGSGRTFVHDASCNEGSSPAPPGLMTHLLTRGLLMMAVSAATATASSVLMAKFSARLRGTEQEEQADTIDTTAAAAAAAAAPPQDTTFLPFQSVGLDYKANACLRGVGALMLRLGPALEALGAHVNESVMIAAVCRPVALYYWGRIALARVAPEVRL